MIRGRWLIVGIAVVAWLVALISWIGDDPRVSEHAYDAFSSYNTSPGGLSQAYGYLAARRPGVTRLIRTVAFEHPPRDATILRFGSERVPLFIPSIEEEKSDPKKEDRKKKAPVEKKAHVWKRFHKFIEDDEEEWVRSGGRLVLAPSGDFAQLHLEPSKCSNFESQVFPIEPPLPKIDVPDCHSMSGADLQRFHALLNSDSGPVIVRRPLGAGEIIIFSIPEAFSNEYLGKGGNLALLDFLAGNRRTVYFDETVHGIEDESSIWDLLVGEWRLGPAISILAAVALLSFWRKARPTGPPERADLDVRSEAVDLVRSMGQLYDRAVDREESLRLYYQGLVRAVHARTGLSGEPLERLVRKRTDGYDPRPRFHDISREEFQRLLKILNHAYETVGYGNTR